MDLFFYWLYISFEKRLYRFYDILIFLDNFRLTDGRAKGLGARYKLMALSFRFRIFDHQFTSATTKSEIIIRAELSLIKLRGFASSEFEHLPQILQKLFELDGIIFRSYILRIIVDLFSGQENLGKRFFGYFDIYIAIVRFKEIIVERLMLLD